MSANQPMAIQQNVIAEIKNTEETYSKNIQALNNFIEKINNNTKSSSIEYRFKKSKEGRAFLAEMQKLQPINDLSQSLCSRLTAAHTSSEISNVFLAQEHNFEAYNAYLASYDKIVKLYASLKNNADFKKLLATDPLVSKMPIGSILIMPVQRLPRYILLFKELAKHEAAPEVYAGLKKVEEATILSNQAIAHQQNFDAWTKALSKKYDSAENLALRTIPKLGNLSASFKTENDLQHFQQSLNASSDGQNKLIVKCDDLKKRPLVIYCISANDPSLTVFEIVQKKEESNFSVIIKGDMAKLKSPNGVLDYDKVERVLDRAKQVSEIVIAPNFKLKVKPKASTIIAPPTPAPVAVPAPSAAKEPEQKPSIKKPTAAKAGLADVAEPKEDHLQKQLQEAQQGLRKIEKPTNAQREKPVEPLGELQLAFLRRQANQEKAAAAAAAKAKETSKMPKSDDDNKLKKPK